MNRCTFSKNLFYHEIKSKGIYSGLFIQLYSIFLQCLPSNTPDNTEPNNLRLLDVTLKTESQSTLY